MDNLQVILGGEKFSVDTAENVNGQMGRTAGAYLGDLPKPAAQSESKLMMATVASAGTVDPHIRTAEEIT